MIHKTFAHHIVSPASQIKLKKLREAYSWLQEQLATLIPPGRELSLAKTELEASAMWATKALIAGDPESVVDPNG